MYLNVFFFKGNILGLVSWIYFWACFNLIIQICFVRCKIESCLNTIEIVSINTIYLFCLIQKYLEFCYTMLMSYWSQECMDILIHFLLHSFCFISGERISGVSCGGNNSGEKGTEVKDNPNYFRWIHGIS